MISPFITTLAPKLCAAHRNPWRKPSAPYWGFILHHPRNHVSLQFLGSTGPSGWPFQAVVVLLSQGRSLWAQGTVLIAMNASDQVGRQTTTGGRGDSWWSPNSTTAVTQIAHTVAVCMSSAGLSWTWYSGWFKKTCTWYYSRVKYHQIST